MILRDSAAGTGCCAAQWDHVAHLGLGGRSGVKGSCRARSAPESRGGRAGGPGELEAAVACAESVLAPNLKLDQLDSEILCPRVTGASQFLI